MSDDGRDDGRKVVLITGCSSGIGWQAARRFARAGFRVYASMRRPEEQGVALREEAERAGWALSTPVLDVTSDGSVQAAVSAMLAATGGRIDVLVNNAGYFLSGPVEETSPEELKEQFETNLVGVLRVTRAVLPAMRGRGSGAVVNMSSISACLVLPVVGPYHASKWALDALTEALRYEMRPFGIRVVALQAGPFKTPFYEKELRARAAQGEDSPYAPLVRRYEELSRWLPKEADIDLVARAIYRAATRRRPPLRWRVGPTSFLGGVLRRFVPDALYEWGVRFAFGLWRRRRSSSAAGGAGRGSRTDV
jgi:NAD(P)-dependent dehydrogenase (short-subunit alcohol dehydrogenase family)